MKNVTITIMPDSYEIRTTSNDLLHVVQTYEEAKAICLKKGYHVCYFLNRDVIPLVTIY